MQVRELMVREPASCHVDTNLGAVALLMWNHDCGAIPVVDAAGKPIGMVTDRDIAMTGSLNNRPLWELRAGDVIGARPVFSCSEGDEVEAALAVMRDQKVRRLPVTDESEGLTGVLSMSDIVWAAQEIAETESGQSLSFQRLLGPLKAVSEPHSARSA